MSENANKKVIIVGAGIAGLAAGIYARRSGFDVTILERHFIPGGLSTSWTRKGYLFEGGMHWLTGSSEKLTLNRIWHEVGALKENNPIFVKDPFYTLMDENGRQLGLYRDAKKLKEHFLEYAPEQKKMINRMYKDIRLFSGVHMPVCDIPGLKSKNPTHPGLGELMAMFPAVLRIGKLNRQSYIDYVAQFKNKNIRHLLMSVIGYRYNALSFIYTMASFASGDCGYPEGGSIRMAQNMADTFTELGGNLVYRTEVTKIECAGKKVKGVYAGDQFFQADAVIVSQDTRSAIDQLFNPPLEEKWANKMRRHVVSEQNMFICLGVKTDLSEYPRAMVFPLNKPFSFAGTDFNEIRVNNYALYKNHAPEGCTTLTCLLLGDSYQYWKQAKADGTYKQKKQELADAFISQLSQFIPQIKDNVEVTDVATPLTYERYCKSFEGSWMSVWEPGGKMRNYPNKSKEIKGLYFAGERTGMPGGLPIAVNSGRLAAQYLCKDNKVMFI